MLIVHSDLRYKENTYTFNVMFSIVYTGQMINCLAYFPYI